MSSTFESKHVLEHCGTLEEHDMCEFSSKTLCDAHVPKSLSELFWFYFSGLKARKEFFRVREGEKEEQKKHIPVNKLLPSLSEIGDVSRLPIEKDYFTFLAMPRRIMAFLSVA